MPKVRIDLVAPNPAPANYVVTYRVKGTTGAYTTLSPNPTSLPIYINGLAYGTEYEGFVKGGCGDGAFSVSIGFKTCTCPSGFVASADKTRCEKIETTAPTITQTNYCLTPSTNEAYGEYFTRIYNTGFSNSSIGQFTAPSGDVFAQLNSNFWRNANGTSGPVNADSVWVDADCDGVKDTLNSGQQATVAFAFENTSGATRTIHVGIAADNQFTLKVNGTVVAATTTGNAENFKIWHIFPVTLQVGFNDFNGVATGDGSVNDAIAMVVYDNSAAQIQAAADYSTLNILFASHQLFGQMINVATCPNTYSLDTSAGVGNYTCRKITTSACTGL